jgi:hypothetical protein
MSDKRYEANIIRATAVEPANNIETTSAPGVWSIDEVVELQKKNKWPTAGNVTTDITDVFSTFLYTGAGGTTVTINNGIDLLNEGGLVWIKARNATENHGLFDTVRGVTKYISSNNTNAEATNSGTLTNFYNNGFKVDGNGIVGSSTDPYVSWTFRKASKFFDVVTYTGNGTAGRTISHNLGSVPGMIIVKQYQAGETRSWSVYHRGIDSSAPENYYLKLESTTARLDDAGQWNDTAPTSSVFTVGDSTYVNNNGESYVAYLFAHNNNNGGFGPNGSDDVIKCGSYTGNESADGPVIDLGFEPQWLMLKNITSGYNWIVVDVMRGFSAGPQANTLFWNTTATEDPAGTRVKPTSTGFQIITSSNDYNKNGNEFIYMAIRRGPLAAPTDATKFFQPSIYTGAGGSGQTVSLNITPDMVINMTRSSSGDSPALNDRLRGSGKEMYTSGTGGESSYPSQGMQLDHTNALRTQTYRDTTNATYVNFCWKRAPGYFDMVAYTGTGSSLNVSHNLGVEPEMIWVKTRSNAVGWAVYHSSQGFSKGGRLETTDAFGTETNRVTAASSTTFSVGTDAYVNVSARTYIAYLFATLAGVSKVGNVVHSGSSTDVDCGFTSGARLVILKRTDATGDWYIWDSVRGIVSGNDPYLLLNSTAAEVTNTDYIDPLSSGFQISGDFTDGTYIFYAVAT